jgi:hypothetical protein
MPQLKITLPDEIRSLLDRATAQSGKSLSQEIQARLMLTFERDLLDKPTQELLGAVESLANLIRSQLGQAWHEHAGANVALYAAVGAAMRRWQAPGEAVLPPVEQAQLVASDDPVAYGVALEALLYQIKRISSDLAREQLTDILEKGKGGKS